MSQMHESTDALTNENTNMQSEPNAVDEAPKKAKKFKGFHPKRFLKNLQGRLQSSQYLYLLFCFFVPVILMYGVYVVKGIYPFYNGSPLVLDLNAQYVSYFEALRDFALGERSILYSFARSLGGEFFGYYTDETRTAMTIQSLYEKEGYLCDTHTAVAVYAAQCYQKETGDTAPMVVASTASPYKFAADVFASLCGKRPEDEFSALAMLSAMTGTQIPAPLANLDKKEIRFDPEAAIEADSMPDSVLEKLNLL